MYSPIISNRKKGGSHIKHTATSMRLSEEDVKNIQICLDFYNQRGDKITRSTLISSLLSDRAGAIERGLIKFI